MHIYKRVSAKGQVCSLAPRAPCLFPLRAETRDKAGYAYFIGSVKGRRAYDEVLN